ncbi:ABC transporter permease, partial [Vibrio diabolicus]
MVDISWTKLALFGLILLVPFFINARYKLGIAKDTIISVIRMTLQLILIGVYLEYLFQLNSLLVNILWLAIMLLIGASSIAGKARLPK